MLFVALDKNHDGFLSEPEANDEVRDSDRADANEVLRCLAQRGATIVSAEACTASLIASSFSPADGAAEVLHGGFVAYTKAHKARALGVSKRLIGGG